MDYRRGLLDGLLQLVSTSRLKSAVTLAAVSFAVCHLVFIATGAGAAGSAELELEIPRQLIHYAAELCRFGLPLGFLVTGLAAAAKTSAPGRFKR